MRLSIAIVVSDVLAELAPEAEAAFPGASGRIAFDRDWDSCFNERIYLGTVDSDGSGFDQPLIDFNIEKQEQPSWSPDGTRLAYYEDGTIATIKPDGSEHQRISFPGFGDQPAWSPDGTRIVFSGAVAIGPVHLWVAGPDGT